MRSYVLGALIAGVLLALDFDPVDLPYSGIVGVAAFFVIAHRLDPVRRRDVALLGFAFGIGFMAPLIWWMHAVSYGAYVALALVQALFFVPILFGLRLVSRLQQWPIGMPAVWVLGESVRSMVPFSGFPWGRLAHTTVDTPLDGYVRWVGLPATSFIVCLLAAGLAWFVVRPREQVVTVIGSAAAVAGARRSSCLRGSPEGMQARRRRSRWCRATFREVSSPGSVATSSSCTPPRRRI